MVVSESSYETRARFVSLVYSGWSFEPCHGQGGHDECVVGEVVAQACPYGTQTVYGARQRVALLQALVMWPGPQRDRGQAQRRALTLVDRRAIAVGLRLGMTQGAIADFLGRCKSVISREISRHRSSDGNYYADLAGAVAAIARARPKAFKLHDRALCARIEAWMDQGWSPQLIARVLAAEPGSTKMSRVSHETIYRALYVQSRGQLRKDLYRKLSLRRKQRKARGTPRQDSPYRDAFKIRDRPAEESRRPRGAMAMGRRLDPRRWEPLGGRHPDRTDHPVRGPAAPAQRSQRRRGRRGGDPPDETARASAPIHHLRPRHRNGPLPRHQPGPGSAGPPTGVGQPRPFLLSPLCGSPTPCHNSNTCPASTAFSPAIRPTAYRGIPPTGPRRAPHPDQPQP